MKLTRQSNYAIRTLMYCAVNETRLNRIGDIAAAYSISELFLFKLIKSLVDNGLLVTMRGRGGGIRLGRPANEITLLDVLTLTEENFALAECLDGTTECPLVGDCDLNGALRNALDAFFGVLKGYTIADLTRNRRSLRARLGLEQVLGAS